jgi:hypothetical protein
MITLFYYGIVLYFTVHFIWRLFLERGFWQKAGVILVLISFLLRLMMVK